MKLLTKRQRQIAEQIAIGKDNHTIARELCISQNTVKQHVYMICDKFQCNTRGEIAAVYYLDVINTLYSDLLPHVDSYTLNKIFDEVKACLQ